jgi:hypothetical protein
MEVSYSEILQQAVDKLIADYTSKKILLFSEGDLQSHLFAHCRRIMESYDFPAPLKIFVEYGRYEIGRKRIDLVLGDDIFVEIKFEPDYPGVSKPVVFKAEVFSDIEKIASYAKKGKKGHFIMIDEDGMHRRNVLPERWKKLENGMNFLHVKTH